jgi:hypothetical protein
VNLNQSPGASSWKADADDIYLFFNPFGETMFKIAFATALVLSAQYAAADNAVIENVRAVQTDGLWTFDVTISHDDEGWGHFADAWRILDGSGNQIAIRELIHPHVDEQPLTRSLSGVAIPAGITEVGVQARDTMSGWSDDIKKVKLK